MSYPGTDDLLGAVEDEAVPGSDLLLDVLGALGLGPRSPLARQAGGFALAGMDAAFLGMLLSEALGLDAGWAGAFARSYAAGRAGIKPGAGPLAGALSPGGSAVVRDFSDEARAELRSIAQEVAAEPWFDPSTWDAWYRAEAWFGRLTIDNYQHDLASYFRKVVDVNDASAQDIDRIFDRAVERDAAFARSLSGTPQASRRPPGRSTRCWGRDGREREVLDGRPLGTGCRRTGPHGACGALLLAAFADPLSKGSSQPKGGC